MQPFISDASEFLYDHIFYILCFIGFMYFFFRVTNFFNKLKNLLWNSKNSTKKPFENPTP